MRSLFENTRRRMCKLVLPSIRDPRLFALQDKLFTESAESHDMRAAADQGGAARFRRAVAGAAAVPLAGAPSTWI